MDRKISKFIRDEIIPIAIIVTISLIIALVFVLI